MPIHQQLDAFKEKLPTDQSSVVLAGTGPNGSIHIPVLHKLGHDFLTQLHTFDVISASSFALMIFYASKLGYINTKKYSEYENYVRKSHKTSITTKVTHLFWHIFRGKSLYSNILIKQAFEYLVGKEFSSLKIPDIPYPVNFHAYCLNRKKVITINKTSFPSMHLHELARACISIPWIHGAYHYKGYQFIDPIISPEFNSLRRQLLKKSKNVLYVNHVKTLQTTSIFFYNPNPKKHPNLSLYKDFLFFYLGIKNNNILTTHKNIVSNGVISDGNYG